MGKIRVAFGGRTLTRAVQCGNAQHGAEDGDALYGNAVGMRAKWERAG